MRFAIGALVCALVACNSSNNCNDMNCARFRGATRVVITVDSREVGTQITSTSRIAAFVAFAEAHGAGWSYPWYGPPVARLKANFYAGDQFLGDFGVGTTFLSAQGCGYFQSRPISSPDRQRLIE